MAQTAWTEDRLKTKGSPYIKCDNLEQRGQVIDVIESWGYQLYGHAANGELYVAAMQDKHEYLTDLSGYDNCISADEFLTPPNHELTALKQRLMEIADSSLSGIHREKWNFDAIHEYINNTDVDTSCTDLANLIINSDL